MASTSATRSSQEASSSSGGWSERPYPRQSGAMARYPAAATASIWWRHEYQISGKPCRNTTVPSSSAVNQEQITGLVKLQSITAGQQCLCRRLTFADLSDVDVEPADGEVGVLDLLRHCCSRCCSSRPAGDRDVSFVQLTGSVDSGVARQ